MTLNAPLIETDQPPYCRGALETPEDAGYQGIAKRPEMAGKTKELRVAIWPGKRRSLPDTPE